LKALERDRKRREREEMEGDERGRERRTVIFNVTVKQERGCVFFL
jgi:hypothetical protein